MARQTLTLSNSVNSHPPTFRNFHNKTTVLGFADKDMKAISSGIGDILVEFHHLGKCYRRLIPDVVFHPNARNTLLSTISLQNIGIGIILPPDTESCNLIDCDGYVICHGQSHGQKLYDLPITLVLPKESTSDQVHLMSMENLENKEHVRWHLRLDPVNSSTLQSMVNKEQVSGLILDKDTIYPDLFCVGCKLGKATQSAYSNSTAREKVNTPGGRVHGDVLGPLPVRSLNGKHYMLNLLDEATQFTRTYFLGNKSEVYSAMLGYTAHMENQYPTFHLGIFRSDGGGEFVSRQLADWFSQHGIMHEKSPPNTPQLNGKAERMNRTIMDKVRSIISMGNLDQRFWQHIAGADVHTINRLPSKAINGKVPFEVLSNRKADVSHLRIIGCDAFRTIKTHQGKLSPTGRHCMLLGYGPDTGVYQVWDPTEHRVVTTRDVTFNEDGFIRSRYLPYYNHFGMGIDRVGGTLEVPTRSEMLGIPPTKQSESAGLLEPPHTRDSLTTPLSLSKHGKHSWDDDSNLNDFPVEGEIGIEEPIAPQEHQPAVPVDQPAVIPVVPYTHPRGRQCQARLIVDPTGSIASNVAARRRGQSIPLSSTSAEPQ